MTPAAEIPSTSQGVLDNDNDIDLWFDGLIGKLRTHQLMLKSGTAPRDLQEFYESIINGDEYIANEHTREKSSQYFIKLVLKQFITDLNRLDKFPNKIAADLSDHKIMLWVEVDEDDWNTEKNMYLIESRINSRFKNNGFFIDTFIIPTSESPGIPQKFAVLLDSE